MLLYVKTGHFIPGVPMRDLTEDDLAALADAGVGEGALLGSGVYERAPEDIDPPGEYPAEEE